jgi:hypothetical protein
LRTYERRRASLLEVQEACLGLRDSLFRYGQSLDKNARELADAHTVSVEADVKDTHDYVSAQGLLDVRLSRIDVATVSTAVATWRERAQQHFLSTEDVSTSEELISWVAMNDAVGAALAK